MPALRFEQETKAFEYAEKLRTRLQSLGNYENFVKDAQTAEADRFAQAETDFERLKAEKITEIKKRHAE